MTTDTQDKDFWARHYIKDSFSVVTRCGLPTEKYRTATNPSVVTCLACLLAASIERAKANA